ncbi:MAG: hypothetical protein IT383_06420 [Deltaproteobacteria bacterium]|nr:hypothetical protein [Deltaproteobacteria bacterium]
MRRLLTPALLTLALLAPSAAFAKGDGAKAERQKRRLAWVYDDNGDGKLDAAEKATLDADRAQRKAARVARVDTNHDGTISPEERAVAKDVARHRRAEKKAERLAKHDANKDGTLDPLERSRAKSAKAAALDKNKDGKLDATETAAARAAARARLQGKT